MELCHNLDLLLERAILLHLMDFVDCILYIKLSYVFLELTSLDMGYPENVLHVKLKQFGAGALDMVALRHAFD